MAAISLPINRFNAIKRGCSHCSGNGKGVVMNGLNANKRGVHMGTDTVAATQCEQALNSQTLNVVRHLSKRIN